MWIKHPTSIIFLISCCNWNIKYMNTNTINEKNSKVDKSIEIFNEGNKLKTILKNTRSYPKDEERTNRQ